MPYYLGKRPQGDWVLFLSPCTPTQETHGHLYIIQRVEVGMHADTPHLTPIFQA